MQHQADDDEAVGT